jgi:predicted RNase H-like HicB family nuclease
MEKLSCNVSVFSEQVEGKEIYVARCQELGISDFGDTIPEALNNLKIALNLLIKFDPQKAKLLQEQKSFLTTKLFL